VNTGILRKCEKINYSAWVLKRATTGHLVSESRYVEDALIITPNLVLAVILSGILFIPSKYFSV
jgi:hypothetical protein